MSGQQAVTLADEPSFIPVAMPDLSGNEERYVVEAVRSSWISSSGAFLDRFEAEFATACDSRFALGVSNGTTALHLVLTGLNVQPGDGVIVPSMTSIATANAIRSCGGTPVFIDVDPDTWCITAAAIEAAITPRDHISGAAHGAALPHAARAGNGS
ncbi:MAG: aminotransferase class I/II-fold pyridoxal phosphate-dependent enzyme [Planctomycetota bacterium]